MKTKVVLTFIIISFSWLTKAQNSNNRVYDFYYGIGMSNFNGDIGIPTDADKIFWISPAYTTGPMLNVGLRYKYKTRHHFQGGLYLGQFYAEDIPNNPDWYYRGYRMSSFFTELSVRYEFVILKENSRKTVYKQLGESRLKNFNMPLYIFVGFGGTFNTGSLKNFSGENAYSESFVNFAPVIPLGLGVKFRVARNSQLNIEAGHRFTFSEGIDNANGKENSEFGEYWDQYQFLTINFIHRLKANHNGLPKFKKR